MKLIQPELKNILDDENWKQKLINMPVKHLKHKWPCLLKKKTNNENLKGTFVGSYQSDEKVLAVET